MEPTTLEIIDILNNDFEPYDYTSEGEPCYTKTDIIMAINSYFGYRERRTNDKS